jgi:streptogramin lyase
MTANRQGTVYVVASGQILRVEGATGKLLGKFEYPDGDRFHAVALTPEGGLLATWYEARTGVITSIQGYRDDLVRFDVEGKVTQVLRGVISSLTGSPEIHNYPAVDGRGNIFIAGGSFNTAAIFKFTPEGKFVDRFGNRGSEGQFSRPQAIAVDNQSRVYVADTRIQVFDATGRYLGMFQGSVWAMAFNDQNELFTVSGTQVTKFRLNQP